MTPQPIPSTTDELIAEIEQLSEKATQGKWWIDSHGRRMSTEDGLTTVFIASDKMGGATRHKETGNLSHWPNDWDASYIAACSPANIRALIARIRELEDVLGMYSLPLGGDINQDCAEFGGDAVHRELMRRTVLDGSKVTPP